MLMFMLDSTAHYVLPRTLLHSTTAKSDLFRPIQASLSQCLILIHVQVPRHPWLHLVAAMNRVHEPSHSCEQKSDS